MALFETYDVYVGANAATFRAQDGSQTIVPLHALQRSAQLQDTLLDAQADDFSSETITLPAGVLRAWLGSLYDLGIVQDVSISGTGSEKPECLLERNLPLIQAADFLNDEGCLNQLISRTASGLFPSPTSVRTQIIDTEVINELSEGLVLKVLRACKQPFFRHLAVLPADLHEAALHACFPHILASATLHIEPVKAQSEIDTLSKFLPQLLHLKSLQVIGVPGQHRYDADVLAGKVLQLTELQRLDFKSVRLCVKQVGSEACLDLDFWQLPHLTWLTMSDISSQRHVCISGLGTGLHKLQKHYRLHHLDVSRNMYSSTESQSIADAICGFTSLRSLNLNGTNVFPDAEGVCIQGTNLWSLEKLELSGRWAKSEGAADFLSHIGNMSALKYLNLDCQPFHSSSFHPFISSFTGLSSLTCLSLINSSLAIDQISRLATEIDQLSALQELYLENCHIDSVVWEMFAQARSRGVKVRHRLGDS